MVAPSGRQVTNETLRKNLRCSAGIGLLQLHLEARHWLVGVGHRDTWGATPELKRLSSSQSLVNGLVLITMRQIFPRDIYL